MIIFDFDYDEIIIENFKIFSKLDPPKYENLKNFLHSNQLNNANLNDKIPDIDILDFQTHKDFKLFGLTRNEHYLLKLYNISSKEQIDFETYENFIDISDLLLKFNGIKVTSILFCNRINTENSIIIFLTSNKLNYLVRYDSRLNNITDIQSFSMSSYIYHSTLPKNNLFFVIDPNEKIAVLLANQVHSNDPIICPPVEDLKSVLSNSNIMAVQVLFRFWLTKLNGLLTEAKIDKFDFLYNGIPAGEFLNFLCIHISVMLDVIWNHCDSDNSSSSLGNRFVEQLSSLTNQTINDAINILWEFANQFQINMLKIETENDEISRIFRLLCSNGNRFRKLVLSSRWSLTTYRKVSLTPKLKEIEIRKNSIKKFNKWNSMEKEEIIKDGLLSGQIAAMKSFIQIHRKEILTENEINNQIKLIILSNVENATWNDLIQIIKKLGYQPVPTLTSLYLETDIKQIRDVICNKLDLVKQNPEFKIAKNMIDELENAFECKSDFSTISSVAPTTETSGVEMNKFYSSMQSFIERFDKSKCQSLRSVLLESREKNHFSQPIKLKLNWFMEYYKSSIDKSGQVVLDLVNMCLIDADYKNSLSTILPTSENYQGYLKIWLTKWASKNQSSLTSYLTMSNNTDLMIAVLELSSKSNFIELSYKIIIQLFVIVSSSKLDPLYTLVNKWFARNVLMFLFINKPEFFINQLVQWCPNDLTQASELMCHISPTIPLHYMCQDNQCQMYRGKLSDSPLFSFINQQIISKTISTRIADEFPILLYFNLDNHRNSPMDLCPANDYLLKSTFDLSAAIKTNSQISLFQSLLSEKVSNLDERHYTFEELDEIVYAAFFAGISFNELTSSDNEVMLKTNKILLENDYWSSLRKRLLRPQIKSEASSNVEQYYDVNLYNFLHRCGIPLNLSEIFSWQSQNIFSAESKTHLPTISYLERKHLSLFETSKYSLDYVYYLSLGRPFQAYVSIINEFSDTRKPNTISQEILKDIERSIHQIALSNVYDENLIGSCFGLLRLIGLNPESLRCYLTLIKWIIDWHVISVEQANLSESSGSQTNSNDTRKYYEIEIGKHFKICLLKKSAGKKSIRKKLLKQIEDVFIYRLENNFYADLPEVFESWSLVLYFCQLQGIEFSTELLQYFAGEDNWLQFLCCAQIFGYSKDQVKLGINKFKNTCFRQHMSYIASKVEDFNTTLMSKREDSIPKSRRLSIVNNIPRTPVNANQNLSEGTPSDMGVKLNALMTKDYSRISKKNTTYSLSILLKAAKKNLFELIFDCQLNLSNKDKFSSTNEIHLNHSKLLAFSLVLNHPFLTVLAFCSEQSSSDQIPESNLNIYLNYVCCFILSSFPERILKEFWNKWDDTIKIEWNEEETVELIGFAINNKLSNVVADAFYVLEVEKYDCISSFFSMITQTVDLWNPIQRESYLKEFVHKCKLIKEANYLLKDKQRPKSYKDNYLIFFNRILESSLIVALNTVQNNLGSRFVYNWIQSLSSSKTGLFNVNVKQLFSFNDVHVDLLATVFSIYYDYFDLEKNSKSDNSFKKKTVPLNVKSRDFIEFIEHFIDVLISKSNDSVDYIQSQLVVDISYVTNRIITEAHIFGLPYDKKDVLKVKLHSLNVKFPVSDVKIENSMVDLVSMAFAGQNDKEEIVQLCTAHEQKSPSDEVLLMSICNISPTVNHGKTNSWRRLVIPEDWQDQIFTISELSNKNSLEGISHVNSLLNEKKWIEACSYMIENDVYVKDAIHILIAMKFACGKLIPNQWPSFLKEAKHNKDTSQKHIVRRRSIFTNSTSKLNALASFDIDPGLAKSSRKMNRESQASHNFLRNIMDKVCHGQVILEYIYTINCVANKMTESYLTIAKGEEFDVFTKILVGTCREKIDTADMYLGVVDIDLNRLSKFLADVVVQVLRSELQTHLPSTASGLTSTSIPTSIQTPSTNSGSSKNISFTISPTNDDLSKQSSMHKSNKNLTVTTYIGESVFQDYVSKVAQRCQLRSELSTSSTSKLNSESRLLKTFSLQDLLILSSCYRRLGEILYSYYQQFSQEVFSCKEDAEFLVLMLIQCHDCFTEGGDTVGISNCLKAAKELSRALTSHSYFVLLAQLLCRIGRYGEMSYVFADLIANEHFELLLRKDMDKEGVIVPYVLDYLSRNVNDDFEKVELVCLKYNCFFELAETKSKKANILIKSLRSQSWKNVAKETIKTNLIRIICNLLDACKNYFKVGCYKKVKENFRRSQFYYLQHKWIEDPDKLFTVGSISAPINKSLKTMALKLALPETGFSAGIRIIDMNGEEALNFLKRVSNFYTAFIIIDHLRLSPDVWTDLIVHHVLQNGDELYLQQYITYFGRSLSPNFVQLCCNKLDNMSAKSISKQSINLRLLLNHCNDVFLVRRLSEKYKLNK